MALVAVLVVALSSTLRGVLAATSTGLRPVSPIFGSSCGLNYSRNTSDPPNGVKGNDPHSECPPGMYCAEDKYCRYCLFCYANYDSITKGVEEQGCPKKCACSPAKQDCPPGMYCEQLSLYKMNDTSFCRDCAFCSNTGWGEQDLCVEKCKCGKSSDCPDGYHCSWPISEPFLRRFSFPVCTSCSDADTRVGCVEDWLANKAADSDGSEVKESCRDICTGYFFECSNHGDCNSGSGNWCSRNHRCYECSPDCWLATNFNGTVLSSDSHNKHPAWQLPQSSIDGSCPESCCDWTHVISEGWNPEKFKRTTWIAAGPCDPNSDLEAYWIPHYSGLEAMTKKDKMTPDNFRLDGKPCTVTQRYDSDTTNPKRVTVFECDALIWSGPTLAVLVLRNKTSTSSVGDHHAAVGNAREEEWVFLNEDQPMNNSRIIFDDGYEPGTLIIMLAVSVCIQLVALFCIGLPLWR